jgi:nucleotide-binding universal stress UspA family protein
MTSEEKIVLVALDGSSQAARAIPLARTVAAQLHARLTAIHVAPGPPPADARGALGLDTPGLEEVPIRVLSGRPADEIARALDRPEVELLVLTTLAGGDPDRELGSVAREVAVNSTRPLLTLRPDIGHHPARTAPPLSRLLVPIDGTIETACALRPVTTLAKRFGASVDVLYVVAGGAVERAPGALAAPRYVDQPQHEWRSWESEVRERLIVECAGFSPSAAIAVHVRQGDPGGEIVRFAREGHFDAIVLVRRSRMEAERAPTLRHVIRESPCPLLVVGGEA